MPLSNPYVAMLFWSAATILLYLAAKRVYRRFPMWWLTPLAVTPLLLMALLIGMNENYRSYFGATHWLVALLGPATVALPFRSISNAQPFVVTGLYCWSVW